MKGFLLRVVLVAILVAGLGGCGIAGVAGDNGCKELPGPLLSRLKDSSKKNFTNENGDLYSHFEYRGSAMRDMAPEVRRYGLSKYAIVWGVLWRGDGNAVLGGFQYRYKFVTDDAGERVYGAEDITASHFTVDVAPPAVRSWLNSLYKELNPPGVSGDLLV